MTEAMETVDIAENIARVRERIARAENRAGRASEEIRLVAVSKVVEAARVREAIAAGITDLGENYVQEADDKREQLPGQVRWHLIGHLQSNKAAKAASIFDIVHTVDSLRLARALGRQARELGRELDLLLQVNTSGEATKSGVEPSEVEGLLAAVRAVDSVRVRGLMTIGRWDPDPEQGRAEFRLLAQLGGGLAEEFEGGKAWLSMGMSHDFEVAIEEGSTLVRVGTGIFGQRPA
jgi:PLP dependent protein